VRGNSDTSEKIEESRVQQLWVGVGVGVLTWCVSTRDSEAHKLSNFVLERNERKKSQLSRENTINNVYWKMLSKKMSILWT